MAPCRHDDKRRTAVRTRGAGPREGAVKGPVPISLVYRDGWRPDAPCAPAREATAPPPHLRTPSCRFGRNFPSSVTVGSARLAEAAAAVEIPPESPSGARGQGERNSRRKLGLGRSCSSYLSSVPRDQLDLSLIDCWGTGNSSGRVRSRHTHTHPTPPPPGELSSSDES